jgi:hypothetical protein
MCCRRMLYSFALIVLPLCAFWRWKSHVVCAISTVNQKTILHGHSDSHSQDSVCFPSIPVQVKVYRLPRGMQISKS